MKAQLTPLQDAESLQWLRHLSWSDLSTRSWPISAGALLLIVWQPMLGPQPSSKPPISTWHASDLSYYRNVRSHETTSLILYGISACWWHCLNKATWHLTSKLLNYIHDMISLILDTCSASACFMWVQHAQNTSGICQRIAPRSFLLKEGTYWASGNSNSRKDKQTRKPQDKRAESVDSQLLCPFHILYYICILTRAARQVMLTQTSALLYIHFTAALGPSCHEATIGYRWRFMT